MTISPTARLHHQLGTVDHRVALVVSRARLHHPVDFVAYRERMEAGRTML